MSPRPVHPDVESFGAELRRRTPYAWVTPTLIVANVAVFVALVALGVSATSPLVADLIRYGANFGPKTTNGEWWRLGSSMFLHIGIIHLGMNMVVLWQMGRFVERVVGNVPFLAAYLVSGLGGSLVSLWWNPQIVSAGASGAVFGVFGMLGGVLVVGRRHIPPAAVAQMRNMVLSFLGLNLIVGLQIKGIDLACHFGGLLTGIVAGFLVAQPSWRPTDHGMPVKLALVLGFGTVLVAVGIVATPAVFDFAVELDRYAAIEKEAHDAALALDTTPGPASLAKLDAVLPKLDSQLARWSRGRGLRPDQDVFRKRLVRYLTALDHGWHLVSDGIHHNDIAKRDEGLAALKEAGTIAAEFAPAQTKLPD